MRMMTPAFFLLLLGTTLAADLNHTGKVSRHLPTHTCSRLQHELQKSILIHDWDLRHLKFQQRLKRHPNYIVSIEDVQSTHDPIIELRCPGEPLNHALQILFHEARFSASTVRLFDIHSIFPIHSGSMGVKVRLGNLEVVLGAGSDLNRGVTSVQWRQKEEEALKHRELDLTDLEKEIESVFLRRIQPDIQNQIRDIVTKTTTAFFEESD